MGARPRKEEPGTARTATHDKRPRAETVPDHDCKFRHRCTNHSAKHPGQLFARDTILLPPESGDAGIQTTLDAVYRRIRSIRRGAAGDGLVGLNQILKEDDRNRPLLAYLNEMCAL